MKNKTLLIIASFSIIIFILVIIILSSSHSIIESSEDPSNTNATPSTTVDNFSDFYLNIPQAKLDSIQSNLYNTISYNYSTPPTNGATIRNNQPTIYSYNNSTNIYYGRFIVDIPSIQQSYMIQFEWTPDPANERNLSGYNTLVTCLPNDLLIYPSFNCSDMLTAQGGN